MGKCMGACMKMPQWLSVGGVKSLGFLCFLVLVGTSAAQWRQPEVVVVETLPTGQVDWTAGLVRSTAHAAVASRAAGPATTLNTAVEMARQRLRETLSQLQLDATRTVGSVVQGTVEKQQHLAALVASAEIVETRYLARGDVESTVQMPLFGPFTALLWPEPLTPVATVEPVPEAVHTGIIIDARGLAVQWALLPQIFDEEGHTLYAPAGVHVDMARQRGYIVYAAALDSPQIEPRVGNNPLVLRARRVADRTRVNLIMQQADALQIQRSTALQSLLAQCRVVIVG
jgi:hypothetical protein